MVDSSGIYMMDTGEVIYLYVGRIVNPAVLQGLLGTSAFASLPEQMVCLQTSTFLILIGTFFKSTLRFISTILSYSYSMNYLNWTLKNLNDYGVSINICRIRSLVLLYCSSSGMICVYLLQMIELNDSYQFFFLFY